MTYLTSVADGIADGGSTTFDSPTLTVSGSNKVMYVLVGNSDSTPADPTGVAWDPTGVNQALTKISGGLTYGTFGNASLWRLIAPTNVTNGIVRATWAAAKGERILCAWVETGIDQTTPNGTVANASVSTGNTDPISAGAVSTTTGQRLLMFAHSFYTGVFPGAGQFLTPSGTERHDIVTSGTAYDALAAQEQTATGSSTTPQWASISQDMESGWAAFALALNDAGAAATDNPRNFDEGIPLAHYADPGYAALFGHYQQGIPQANRADSTAILASGAGSASITFADTGAGAATAASASSGSVVFNAQGTGAATVAAASSGSITLNAQGAGASTAGAASSGSIVFGATAEGAASSAGAGAGSAGIQFGATAAGASTAAGDGSAAVTFDAQGAGASSVGGAGSGAIVFDATGSSEEVPAPTPAPAPAPAPSSAGGGASGWNSPRRNFHQMLLEDDDEIVELAAAVLPFLMQQGARAWLR